MRDNDNINNNTNNNDNMNNNLNNNDDISSYFSTQINNLPNTQTSNDPKTIFPISRETFDKLAGYEIEVNPQNNETYPFYVEIIMDPQNSLNFNNNPNINNNNNAPVEPIDANLENLPTESFEDFLLEENKHPQNNVNTQNNSHNNPVQQNNAAKTPSTKSTRDITSTLNNYSNNHYSSRNFDPQLTIVNNASIEKKPKQQAPKQSRKQSYKIHEKILFAVLKRIYTNANPITNPHDQEAQINYENKINQLVEDAITTIEKNINNISETSLKMLFMSPQGKISTKAIIAWLMKFLKPIAQTNPNLNILNDTQSFYNFIETEKDINFVTPSRDYIRQLKKEITRKLKRYEEENNKPKSTKNHTRHEEENNKSKSTKNHSHEDIDKEKQKNFISDFLQNFPFKGVFDFLPTRSKVNNQVINDNDNNINTINNENTSNKKRKHEERQNDGANKLSRIKYQNAFALNFFYQPPNDTNGNDTESSPKKGTSPQ